MNVLRSLRHRPFALLWTGQTTSRLGDSLYRIALSWWVLEKTGSAASLGSVVGMIWLGQSVRLPRRGLFAYFSIVVTGVMMLPFAFKLPIPILIGSMSISGISFAVFALIWTHTLQEMVPGDMLGRVYSIDALGSFVLLPIGFALAVSVSSCSYCLVYLIP